ncbi:MAG: metalloregulator ArsR/SmtB family transcription factor [Pseudomonadota bacterium]
MELNEAARRLTALSQEGRLAVFRLLVRAGREGMAAGEISRALSVAPNTLTNQLTILSNAGLVESRRAGRSIIYRADYDAISNLLVYLMEDCCAGRSEVREGVARRIPELEGTSS